MTHDYVAWTGPNCGHVQRCGRPEPGPHRETDLREVLRMARGRLAHQKHGIGVECYGCLLAKVIDEALGEPGGER